MDDKSIKVNNFINECKQFSHYQFLNERPDYFDGWESQWGERDVNFELNVIIANGLCKKI